MTRPVYRAADSAPGPRVLCPDLYHRLKEVFGEVVIANPGEAMTARVTQQGGRRWLDVAHAGEYYRVNCFVCRDTRKRLWINHMYGQPYTDNRRLWFLAVCYNEDCLSQWENRRALEEMLFGFQNASVRRRVFQVLPGEVVAADPLTPQTWPGECLPAAELPRTHPMVAYFAQRDVPQETLVEYDVRYCARPPEDSRLQLVYGRAVIPVVMGGQMVGWQARVLQDGPQKYPPKYFTSPGMPKSRILYNLDRARQYPFVILVEGPTDVWRVGPPAVALFGKTLSTGQRQLLRETWSTGPIVVLLDGDAQEAASNLVEELRSLCPRNPVALAPLPAGYDPADMDREAVWGIIYAALDAAWRQTTT